MNDQQSNEMSGRKKKPNKNLYGRAKIEAAAAEKASRHDDHEAAAIEHDRSTQLSRAKFANFASRKVRYNQIHDESEARIIALRAEMEVLERKKVEMKEKLGEMEEKEGNEAEKGERDAEISEKYRQFLEMESEELGL